MKTLLHVGCGPAKKAQTTNGFNTPAWSELRLDINPNVQPDIIGTMTDMSGVESASVDAIFSSHNIEHLYPHEVPVALKEFVRVLKSDGFLVITCPDLKSVAKLVVEDKLFDVAYMSPAGPIAAIDILYGHRPQMAEGNLYMAHRCGFTLNVLAGSLQGSGFKSIACIAREAPFFDLWAVASKNEISKAEMEILVRQHFPGA